MIGTRLILIKTHRTNFFQIPGPQSPIQVHSKANLLVAQNLLQGVYVASFQQVVECEGMSEVMTPELFHVRVFLLQLSQGTVHLSWTYQQSKICRILLTILSQ